MNGVMAAIGRILQVIGWFWFLAGIVGPAFDFDTVNPFPGLVLIFIARIFRTRARSEMPKGTADGQTPPQPEPVEAPGPQPAQQAPPFPPSRPEPRPTAEPEPEPQYERPVDERNELLERIAAAGRQAAPEPAVSEPRPQGTGSRSEETKPTEAVRKPMTSAEMIARARERFDREKPWDRDRP